MTTVVTPPSSITTLADLLDRLGGIPLSRIRFRPPPGTATEADVAALEAHEDRLCELVEGVLVEKPMGFRESLVAVAISTALRSFVQPRKLGVVSGADGMMRLFPGLVRIPDVAFTSRARLPGGHVPRDPVPDLVPDLAVEVLSEGNTGAEMRRKRGEYFRVGVRLVWIVDPDTRTVEVFTSIDESTTLASAQFLQGEPVLPGFSIMVGDLFGPLDE